MTEIIHKVNAYTWAGRRAECAVTSEFLPSVQGWDDGVTCPNCWAARKPDAEAIAAPRERYCPEPGLHHAHDWTSGGHAARCPGGLLHDEPAGTPSSLACFCGLTARPGEMHSVVACVGPDDRIARAVAERYRLKEES